MKDAPAFDFYPSDWLSGTLMMSHEEKGLYVDLLAMQWEQGCLPSDDKLKRLRARPAVLASVLEKFPIGEDGMRRNARLERERVKQRERRERKAEGARKTNAKRWNSESLSDRLATPERQPSDTLSESPPITHHPSPYVLLEKEPKGAGAPGEGKRRKVEDFEDFEAACRASIESENPLVLQAWEEWQAYRQQRHISKGAFRLPWTLRAAQLSARQILQAVKEHGAQVVSDRISSAIVGNWQGLNLDKLQAPALNGHHSRNSTPTGFQSPDPLF